MNPNDILSLYFSGGFTADEAITAFNAYTGGSSGDRWLSYNVRSRSPELTSPPEIWSGAAREDPAILQQRVAEEQGVSRSAQVAQQQAQQQAQPVAAEERGGGVSRSAQVAAQQQAQQARLAQQQAQQAAEEQGVSRSAQVAQQARLAQQQAQQAQQVQQARIDQDLAQQALDESGGQFNLPPRAPDPRVPGPDIVDAGRMWEQGVDPDSQATNAEIMNARASIDKYLADVEAERARARARQLRATTASMVGPFSTVLSTGPQPTAGPRVFPPSPQIGDRASDLEDQDFDVWAIGQKHLDQMAREDEIKKIIANRVIDGNGEPDDDDVPIGPGGGGPPGYTGGSGVSTEEGKGGLGGTSGPVSTTGFMNEAIAKSRYMRSIADQVRSRELTPFQGRYERGKFGDLFGRFELFQAPGDPSDEYGTFLNWLDTDSRNAMETRTRGRELAQFLRMSPETRASRTDTSRDLIDQTYFGGGYEESGQNQQAAVITAALAGVHPLYRASVKRSLLALFEELGGSEAALNEQGNLPFLTAAYDQGYFGAF
jgi:hypothetical protein